MDVRRVVKEDVSRMMNCGDLKNDYRVYNCTSCNEVKKVAFDVKVDFVHRVGNYM